MLWNWTTVDHPEVSAESIYQPLPVRLALRPPGATTATVQRDANGVPKSLEVNGTCRFGCGTPFHKSVPLGPNGEMKT